MVEQIDAGMDRSSSGYFIRMTIFVLNSCRFSVPAWVWAGRAGSFLTIAAALVLAVDHHPPMRWLFVVWTASNSFWLWYGWKIRSGSLTSAQVVFLIIDAIGMTHYWVLGNMAWLH